MPEYEDFEKEHFVFCESCGFYFFKSELPRFEEMFKKEFHYENGVLCSCPWCLLTSDENPLEMGV